MNEKTSKSAEDLFICYKFPPMIDVGGIVLAKRALKKGKAIDVIHNCIEEPLDNDFNEIVEELIDNRLTVRNFEYEENKNKMIEAFNNYINKGLEKLENTNSNYKTITTRSWGLQPNFLALEYKLKHPDTEWTAEFSDPIIYDISNNRRTKLFKLADEDYAKKINAEIDKINDTSKDNEFEHIHADDDIFLLCEYLAYLFADKIVFTNENQREIMLSQFPYDIKDFVMAKSLIDPHPTLDEKYYHIKEVDYEVDEDCINIGYFGTYFGKRNFEAIFYAIESLNDEIKNKIRLHLFINYGDNLNTFTNNLSISKNIRVNEQVPLLEFLNLTTKLDVLLVNDTETKGNFKINPYRPSKIADYLGSKKDIWGICEKNSVMDSLEEIKYKSYINDFYSTKIAINQIAQDYASKLNLDLDEDNLNKNKDIEDYCRKIFNKEPDDLNKEEILEILEENEFLLNRVNHLNHLFNDTRGRGLFPREAKKIEEKNEKLSKDNKKLKNENKTLKAENKKIESENKKYKKDLEYLKSTKGSLKYRLKKIAKQ